jgi:hypothetical protein
MTRHTGHLSANGILDRPKGLAPFSAASPGSIEWSTVAKPSAGTRAFIGVTACMLNFQTFKAPFDAAWLMNTARRELAIPLRASMRGTNGTSLRRSPLLLNDL